MKILFYDATGTLESILMGALLQQRLSGEEYPGDHAIGSLTGFAVKQCRPGYPVYLGNDPVGNKLYALAVGNERWLAPKAIRSLLDLLGAEQDQFLLVDAQKYSHPLIKLGGFIAINLGLPSIGGPLIFAGLRKSFPALVRYVGNFRQIVIKEAGYGLTLQDQL